MRCETRFLAGVGALMALASCGGGSEGAISSAGAVPVEQARDYPVTIGDPFSIGATRYVPADTPLYDEVGLAGGYGGEMALGGAALTASAVGAAHKTLPLPSYVEVTALDTGRTILVRINDRGPMSNERLIDLSQGAVRQLGIADKGAAGVRVRRVNPPENERAVLRAGQMASVRMDTPETLLKVLRDKLAKQAKPAASLAVAEKPVMAKPEPAKAPKLVISAPKEKPKAEVKPAEAVKPAAPAGKGYVVQFAAFASRTNAEALARKLKAMVSPSRDGKMFRVRIGPYPDEKAAQAALAEARSKGYPQARLLRDQL